MAPPSHARPRLQNSVPQRGTRPSILARIEGRFPQGSGGRPGRHDGPALTGHCCPDLFYGARPSVGRVPPRSSSSRLAKLLSHCVWHGVEGQVWASCCCAQHSRRSHRKHLWHSHRIRPTQIVSSCTCCHLTCKPHRGLLRLQSFRRHLDRLFVLSSLVTTLTHSLVRINSKAKP